MKANKGLSAHIIAMFVYIGAVLYVFDGKPTTKGDRVDIVFTCFFLHCLVAIIAWNAHWYVEEEEIDWRTGQRRKKRDEC